MEDYKKLAERLHGCYDPDGSCKDCPDKDLYITGCMLKNTRLAADAIDALLDKLKYAEGERDVVTKHMIELEEQNAALHKQVDELTKAGLIATDRANKAIAELNAYKDTGPIDHIRDLLQAEQDGRLVVLPCKVGDTVYSCIKDAAIAVNGARANITRSCNSKTRKAYGYKWMWGDDFCSYGERKEGAD